MDGTWKPHGTVIKYVVCSSCKQLLKKKDITKTGYCANCV